MTNKEKLIKQLQHITANNEPFFKSDLEAIAEFIIADRKRICYPLFEVMRDLPLGSRSYLEAIDETLKLARN